MRYIRQEIYPKIGKENQEKLKSSKVSIVGIGALGTTVLDILARAGIGKIKIIDNDIVELNNLQRQTLFNEKDINKLKVEVAKEKIKLINSEIEIEDFSEELTHLAINILKDSDLIIDCTDNIYTRFLINDYSRKNKTPWIFGSVIESKGMTCNFTNETPCFSCIFPEPNEELTKCEESGVINTIVHSIAAIQATEAIKILTNQDYNKELINYNIWTNNLIKIKTKKRENCPTCNKNYEYLEGKKLKTQSNEQNKMIVRQCKTKGALEVLPDKNIQLKLDQLKGKYVITADLPILVMLKYQSYDITCYKNGKIIISNCKSHEEAEKITNKIYEDTK